MKYIFYIILSMLWSPCEIIHICVKKEISKIGWYLAEKLAENEKRI
jgi:hypothetical protein